KAKPLNRPFTEIMLREGSFALASFGRTRKVHETGFAVAFGFNSVALKRILAGAFVPPKFRGESALADLIEALLAIAFTPIDRLVLLASLLFFSLHVLLVG